MVEIVKIVTPCSPASKKELINIMKKNSPKLFKGKTCSLELNFGARKKECRERKAGETFFFFLIIIIQEGGTYSCLNSGEDGDGEIPVKKMIKQNQSEKLSCKNIKGLNTKPPLTKHEPSQKGISHKTAEEAEHEGGAEEVGDGVGGAGIA